LDDVGPVSAWLPVRLERRIGVTTAQQADTWLTEDAERMTELPIRISGAQFDDWATSKTNRRSCAARRSSGSGVPDDSLGTAVRVRRAAEAISGRSREDAVGRSQEAERDNDVGFVLNRLRNVYKHRRLPLLAATLAP
jgi:hypothetical protein